jgi:hypothetical protein
MNTLFNVTAILLLIAFPVLYFWKKAKIDLAFFFGFLLGISCGTGVFGTDGIAYRISTVQFSFFIVIITFEWEKELGTYEE